MTVLFSFHESDSDRSKRVTLFHSIFICLLSFSLSLVRGRLLDIASLIRERMDDRVWVNFTYNTIVSVLLCGVIHFAARAVFKKLAPTLYATLPKADRISLAEK